MIKIRYYLLFSLLITCSLHPLYGNFNMSQEQNINNTSDEIPRIYLDCSTCDADYIRQEIVFVHYVRNPELADIHVFITREEAGVGGQEYEVTFIERVPSQPIKFTLTFLVDRNFTSDEIRRELVNILKMGLAPFMADTEYASSFSLSYNPPEDAVMNNLNSFYDPWNHWVYTIYAGSISLGQETSQTDFDSRWGFFADRVTEEWKIRLRPYFNYEYVKIQRVENEQSIISSQHRHGFDSFFIKSLSDHWSAGIFADYITRNDRNLKHRTRFNFGVEYSLYPYNIATRRAITFTYQIGYSAINYYEKTIFDKTAEQLLNHELEAGVQIQQPWGNIYGGVNGSHYFHDADFRRAEVFLNVSVRLVKGLSLGFELDFQSIQDQLSLPAGDASLEDVLLRRRELFTDFSLNGSIALSYTFGSEFTNIVNTRF